MLYYDRTDVFVDIDVNKTSGSKECIICRYWYFWIKGSNFKILSAIGVMMYQACL